MFYIVCLMIYLVILLEALLGSIAIRLKPRHFSLQHFCPHGTRRCCGIQQLGLGYAFNEPN